MGTTPWIMISILILLVILGVLFLLLVKKKKHRPDYYIFFVMGILWIPLGIALKNYAFSVMGLIFMLIGLVNKDKWKQNRRSRDKLTKEERKFRMIIMIVLSILVLAGIVFLFLAKKALLS